MHIVTVNDDELALLTTIRKLYSHEMPARLTRSLLLRRSRVNVDAEVPPLRFTAPDD